MSESARSPLSGCTILIVAVLVLVFLIGFSVWLPFRQADEIEKFTQETPEPVPALRIPDHEEEATALVERLESFRSSLSDKDAEAEIRLSTRDLNLAIALFEPLEEMRGTFHVDEISDGVIHASICYQLNGRPRLAREGEEGPITSDPRYLVASLNARPVLSKREFVLSVDSLEVPGSEIPEGFMGHFSTLRIFEQSKDDPVIGPVMGILTKAVIEEDQLVLARIPGAPLPDVVTDEEFQKGGGKIAMFLGGAILLFLLFAGLVLFVGYRAQLRKIQQAEKTEPTDSDA